MMTRVSRADSVLMSCTTAVPPPTRTSSPTSSTAERSRSTVASASGLSEAVSSTAETCTWSSTTRGGAVASPGGPSTVSAALATPSTPETTSTSSSAASCGPMTLTGTPVPAGKWRPRTSWPATESTSVVNCSAVVRPSASQLRRVQRGEGEGERGRDPDGPRTTADQRGDPPPDALVVPHDVVVARDEGVEPVAAQHHEQRRQEHRHRDDGAHDADRADRAERLVAVEVRQQQAQQAEHDGRAGGEDRRERALPGGPHGDRPAVLAVQLLLEAADEQQGVVGARSEHEDRQDALALPVDRQDARLGDEVDDRLREHQRHAGRDEHGQEHRAAVDEQQDHQDDADGGEQQPAVDPLEGCGEVGELPARPGDVAGQAVDLRRRGHLLDDAGQRLEGGVVARQRARRPGPPDRPRSGSAATPDPRRPPRP